MVPPREMTAMTFSVLRGEAKLPENRRPSCLSTVSVNGTLRSCGSFDWADVWCGFPAPSTIDSLSPFQVPRRSGNAVCAAAGNAASTPSVSRHASFDMVHLLQLGSFNHVVGDQQEFAADRQTQLS